MNLIGLSGNGEGCRRVVLTSLLVGVFGLCLPLHVDAAGASEFDDVDEAIASVLEFKAEVDVILQELYASYEPESSPEEIQSYMKRYQESLENDIRPRLNDAFALLKPFAEDERIVAHLTWIISNDPGFESAENAAELLKQHHLNSDETRQLVSMFRFAPMRWTIPLAELLVESADDDQARLESMMILATCYKTQCKMPDLFANLAPSDEEMIRSRYSDSYLEELRNIDSTAIEALAIKTFEAIIADFGETPYFSRTAGEVASSSIFEIKHLSIGKEAPDIEGEDIDGIAFKLSDYRGKVVMLDFWGDW